MTVEVLTPTSREEWLGKRKLGASETPVLLVPDHPYQSPYGLWAQHSGLAPPRHESHDLRLGRYVESAALKFLAEDKRDWIVTPNVIGEGGKLYVDHATGLSCTPDALIHRPAANVEFNDALGVCNVKKVGANKFREKWFNGTSIQSPDYIAIQVIHEMLLTGATWGCVAVLVLGEFGSEFHLVDVPFHQGIVARILTEAREFWRRVNDNDPYSPDYGRDGDLIRHMYAGDEDSEISLSDNKEAQKLVARHEALRDIEKAGGAAMKERRAIDAALIHLLGNASRGTFGDGRVVEVKMIHRAGYTADPTIYPSVKIKVPKSKVVAG